MFGNRNSSDSRFNRGLKYACTLTAALALAGCMTENNPPANSGTANTGLPELFSRENSVSALPAKDFPEALRTRSLQLDEKMFSNPAALPGESQHFILNLFETMSFEAEVDKIERSDDGMLNLSGHVVGVDGSYFNLNIKDGRIAGAVSYPGRGYFTIQPTGDRVNKVTQFDPDRLPGRSDLIRVPKAVPGIPPMASPESAPTPESMAKSSATQTVPTMDLLVVYTADAAAGAGGDNAMISSIQAAVTEINTAYANSHINASVNLVHYQKLTASEYTESGDIDTDLDNLNDSTIGMGKIVHDLRAAKNADLVSLVVESGGYASGTGWVMGAPMLVKNYFRPYAQSVVRRPYVGVFSTMAHEVGHNLGCSHARVDNGELGAYSYSFGYKFTGTDGQQYRDIMAYAPGTIEPYFSNPLVSFAGVPTGIPEGQTNSADNAKTINQTALIVAAFYPLGTTPPPARTALFVVGSTSLTAADAKLKARLVDSGYTVVLKTGSKAKSTDATGKAVIVVSATANPTYLAKKFRSSAVPVVNCEKALEDDFGMTSTASGSFGMTTSQKSITISGTVHPITSGISTGVQAVTTSNASINWGKPGAAAAILATQNSDIHKATVYAYEKSAAMPGLVAPERRVQLFLTELSGSKLSVNGAKIFDQAVSWATHRM